MPRRYNNPKARKNAGGAVNWLPLAVTVAVATFGLAAWVLHQAIDDSDSEDGTETPLDADLDYEHADYGENAAYGAADDDDRTRDENGDDEDDDAPKPASTDEAAAAGAFLGSFMSNTMKRTPSPQQLMDTAGKKMSAGIAATGAAISNTLAAIREEDKTAFHDHETWSEEADAKGKRPTGATPESSRRRKTVAIVVSADSNVGDLEAGFHEHASILSHIPKRVDFGRVRLFVLVFAPGLKDHPLDPNAAKPPPSLDSSYSKIEADPDALTPASDKSPLITASQSHTAFNAVQTQALSLVEKETMVLPFTSANGHVHILRHLQPDVVYLQESLSGESGSVVNHIQTWMKRDITLVVGTEGGHGGLVDSESEAERPARNSSRRVEKWWQREDRVGKGRGVVVVDAMRVHDDWIRRVEGRE